jgi:hypothetical protein
MQVIEHKSLFIQVSAEEAAGISGGNLFNFAVFSLLAIQPASFGGTTYTLEEFIVAITILFLPETNFTSQTVDFDDF